MGIQNTKQMHKLPPPLTPAEITTFERNTVDHIIISADKFRIDLTQKHDSSFNQMVISIAAKDFLERVLKHKWYPVPAIPSKYLVQEYVEILMYNHLKHLKAEYSKQMSAIDRGPELQRSARSSRKTNVRIAHDFKCTY